MMPFSPKIIGNPMLPAIHGGLTGAFLETTAIVGVTRELGVLAPRRFRGQGLAGRSGQADCFGIRSFHAEADARSGRGVGLPSSTAVPQSLICVNAIGLAS